MRLREANQKLSRAVTTLARMIAEDRLTGPAHLRPIRRRRWRPPANKGRRLADLIREERDAGW